jgi:diacylglycerol kinase (ATP)
MKLAIIANPISGGGRAFRRIGRLKQAWPYPDWELDLYPTKCREHAGVLARDLLEHPPDLLAVCGGDGTLNEVVSSVPAPPFPVAMIPAGTANVLAHELGLPMNPVQALEIALKKVVRQVDLGIVLGRNRQRFLLMAGVGVDAYIVSKIRPRRRLLGMANFYLASLRAFRTYAFSEFRVLGGDETLSATSCIIANAHSYGGGLVFTPDADMGDGLFDVLILQGKPGVEHFRFILSAWLGKPRQVSCIQRRRLPAVRVEGARGVWVQADGELMGALPIDVTMTPASFPLVVPG